MSMAEAIATAVNTGRQVYNDAYLWQVATILRRDVTLEEDASHATDYKPLPVKIKCKVLTRNDGAEVEEGEQIVSIMGFQVRFPVGSDIRTTDRLEIDGVTYSVIALDAGRSDALFLTATCTRGNQ